MTLTFFMSGKMYFSESLAPAVYGSTNSNNKPFIDHLWALTLTLINPCVCFFFELDHFIAEHVVVDKRAAGDVDAICLFSKSI